jgi:hypothetical protein
MKATSENRIPQQLFAASSFTIALPIPLVPPVTIALLLCSLIQYLPKFYSKLKSLF